MEKISVIVPVYNGEKYLEQCVQSIMDQTYENLEILLINDGSSDRSGQIIEDLRTRDQRIRVLHKPKNEGSGAARNSSISMATGNYLLFVDSDDWLDANHVEDLYDLLRRTNSDIAVTNFTQYYESGGDDITFIFGQKITMRKFTVRRNGLRCNMDNRAT